MTDHLAVLEEAVTAMESAFKGVAQQPPMIEALRAAIALMRGQSWQPIETAPKDGSYILASDGEQDGCAVVHWDCDGWVYAWHQYDGPMQMYSATHWQPLPTPPKDTADEQ